MTKYPINTTRSETPCGGEAGGTERTVRLAAEAELPTAWGKFRILGFESTVSDEQFVVLTRGSLAPGTPALVRIHSQCLTGDVFGSAKCDCGQQLEAAMRMVAAADRGVIVYQQQEGRGIGIINKIRAYGLQDEGADTIEANERLGLPVDSRNYDQCCEILRGLGLRRVRLMSNNPEKVRAARKAGLEVVERISLPVRPYSSMRRYLRTKREQMGHFINLPEEAYEHAAR